MPHGLEYIVRPFQSPGSLGNIVIPATPKETQEQAHIVWGAKGTMPAVKLVNPNTIVNTKKEVLDERDRDTDEVKVEQEGKPENYVMVERARTVRLNKNETGADTNLSVDLYRAGGTFDPKLDPYLHNFSSMATNFKQSGPSNVTWNLKN